MELKQILQKFNGNPKKAGDGYNVKCPCHDDGNASLSINEKEGKILMYCHAGCNTQDIIKKIGLKTSDLFLEEKKENFYTKKGNEDFFYTDELGNIKHKSSKYFLNGKKCFSQSSFKNGEWIKGVKDTQLFIYNLPKLLEWKHKVEFIAIVEGEKCVEACNKIGVLATTNVGGAGKWDKKYNVWLDDVIEKIVILQDNDPAGEKHTQHLKEFFPNAKVVIITPDLPKGDIADWVEKGGDYEKLKNIIFEEKKENAEDDSLEYIEGLPFKIKQGDKYILTQDYIYNEKGDIVSFTPVILSKSLESLDTGDIKAELTFKKNNKWEKIVVKKSQISTTTNITNLSDSGLNINSINAKKMVDFLSNFEMNNNIRIEKMFCTSQLGWNKNKDFLPYTENVVFDADNETMKKYEAYHEKGSIEKWIAKMKEYRKNEYFRFYLNASFAAPLLDILRERGFFVHLWEDSGAGKTAALKAALSIWGDPDTLMTNFNSTKVAFEKMAALYNDLPMGIDERQQANDEILDSLVYMIANGKGKGRGSKSGGLQTQHIWKTIALTTGEEPLSKETSHTGVKNRLLEIQGKPFENNEGARKMYDFLKDNYGTVGKVWIEKIKHNTDYILKKHKEIIEKTQHLKDKLASHMQYMIIMLLTDVLVSEYFFDDDICEFKKIEESLQTFDDADVVTKADDHIKSWILSNHNNFKSDSKIVYGSIEENNAYIYTNILDDELKRAGFSVSKIKKKFIEKGITLKDKDGKHTVVRKMNNKSTRMVCYTFERYDF